MIAKSLIKQNSILCMHAQMCPFKGNLPTENAPVQSVARGEMRKNMIAKSLITQNSILCMHKCVISRATYILKMHQFKVWQVGKGGKYVIVIDQNLMIFHHIKFNPVMHKHVHSRASYMHLHGSIPMYTQRLDRSVCVHPRIRMDSSGSVSCQTNKESSPKRPA